MATADITTSHTRRFLIVFHAFLIGLLAGLLSHRFFRRKGRGNTATNVFKTLLVSYVRNVLCTMIIAHLPYRFKWYSKIWIYCTLFCLNFFFRVANHFLYTFPETFSRNNILCDTLTGMVIFCGGHLPIKQKYHRVILHKTMLHDGNNCKSSKSFTYIDQAISSRNP